MTPQEVLQRAAADQQAGQWRAAEAAYRSVLQHDPNHFPALFMLGGMYIQTGNFAAAIDILQRAIQLQPGFADAHYNIGIAYRNAKQIDHAIAAFGETVRLNPKSALAFSNLGVLLCEQTRLDEGIAAYRQAIQLRPDYADAHYNLGLALRKIGGQNAQAIAALRRATELRPDVADPFLHLGMAYRESGEAAAARAALEQALRLNPSSPANKELGQMHAAAGDNAAALAAFDATLRTDARDAATWMARGDSLVKLSRYADAFASYQQAIAIDAENPHVHLRFGRMLKRLNDYDGALAAFERVIALHPAHADAHNELGAMLQELGRLDEAAGAYRQAMLLDPAVAVSVYSNLILLKLYDPTATAKDIQQELERWNRRYSAAVPEMPRRPIDADPARRLRIGYVSPDFRRHVVGDNMLPLFEHHDHQHFEIFCYSSVGEEDPMTARFRALADGWRDIRPMPGGVVTELIAQDQIDILVDLAVHSGSNRLGIFARRPAPVQVTFAGYPGSTGLQTVDYRLTDPYLDPPDLDDATYTECSYRMPHSFWCYQPRYADLPVAPLPALQNGFVTFGCLNQFSKINESTLALWMRVLRAMPSARLLLLVPSASARERLLGQVAGQIAPERISFVFRQPKRDYLATYDRIDVVLDTLPYNGHTTSLDALWMGVPVLTLAGQTVVGRAGVSQLMNVGLPEWITHTPEEFVARAASIAGDIAALAALRRTLRHRMEASPLMDARGFARDIEDAYRTMWKRWCATQRPNPTETR
jgi:protein O-GlcNAc transferase